MDVHSDVHPSLSPPHSSSTVTGEQPHLAVQARAVRAVVPSPRVSEVRLAERSRDWLIQAERDLGSARWLAEGGFFEQACFAAHQAAEKALKAVYGRLGGVAWGHSVASLLSGLGERTEVGDDVLEIGRVLDRFYVPTRYPNSWESGAPSDYYTGNDAQDAIGRAEQVLRFCQGLLAG